MMSARLWIRAAWRAMRRKPQTYEQAWLRAAFAGSAALIVSLTAAGLKNWPQLWPLYVVLTTSGSFLGSGLAFSWDVSQQDQR
jgi:hypothetical protein